MVSMRLLQWWLQPNSCLGPEGRAQLVADLGALQVVGAEGTPPTRLQEPRTTRQTLIVLQLAGDGSWQTYMYGCPAAAGNWGWLPATSPGLVARACQQLLLCACSCV